MNQNAQALGRLGGQALKGKPKSPEHKAKLRQALKLARQLKHEKVFRGIPISKAESPKPIQVRKCQASYCNQPAHLCTVLGSTVWLCVRHQDGTT